VLKVEVGAPNSLTIGGMAMSYMEQFENIMNPEICQLLDGFVSQLEDLRSGGKEEEINESIWEKFEVCRKLQALREKPTVQMKAQHELERLYNERGTFRKRSKDIENQTMEAIAKLTKVLRDNITQMLNSLKENVNEEAGKWVQATIDRTANFYYVDSSIFREELGKLAMKLNELGDINALRPKCEQPILAIPEGVMNQAKVIGEQLNSLLGNK
jgi:hypothetical protein